MREELRRRSKASVRIGALLVALLAALSIVAAAGTGGLSGPENGESSEESWARRGDSYGLLMRAMFLAREGNFGAAAGEIQKATGLQPDSIDVHIQGASLLLWMGRTSDAESMVRKALAIDSENTEALRLLGDLSASAALGPRPKAKARDEALRTYERLIEMGAEDEQLLQNLASLRLQGGDRVGALDATRRLVVLRPGDRRATGMLAQLLLEEGNEREAARVLLEYVAKHPDDEVLVGLTEDLVRKLDAWELVARIFGESSEFDRRSTPAHRMWGEALLRLRKLDAATRALESAMAATPSDTEVRYNLAHAYRSANRFADASDLALQLALEAPDDPRAHFLLGETLEDQGDHRGSLDAYSRALELLAAAAPSHAVSMLDEIRKRIAMIHLADEDFGASKAAIASIAAADSSDAMEVSARLAIGAEDWSEGRRIVERLDELGESGAAAMIEGEILARTGHANKARDSFLAAVELAGPFMRVRAAEIFFDVSRPELGRALLREWTDSAPDDPDARYFLGNFSYRMNDLKGAEEQLREAIRLNPKHAPALNFLGYSLAEKNERLDEALQLIERALSVDEWNGAYLDSLGWVYFQMGRYAEARLPLERAAREFPQDPTVLEHLGDLYLRVGEHDLALAAWARALEAGPEDVQALRDKISRARMLDRKKPVPGAMSAPQSVDRSLHSPAPPLRP